MDIHVLFEEGAITNGRLTKLKQLVAKPQIRHMGAIIGIAVAGLVTGSLVAVQAGLGRPNPLASPLANFITPIAIPTIIAVDGPSPSPTPSPKTVAAKVSTKVATKKASAPNPPPASSKRSAFWWGVSILPFPLREKNDLFLPEQFRLAKEIGTKIVRTDFSPNNEPANRQAIDLAHQNGLKLVMIIPFGPNDIFSDQNLANNAYQYVHTIVEEHKGQVDVWQLATEPASVAIIDGGHYGVDRIDYPESKYQAVATWLKAATRAVADADPTARRLINDQWVHVGFFDRYFADGGDTDIIGWNWFSDMGTSWDNPVINTKTDQRYALLKKLKSFNRDIWLTEVNRRGGSNDGNEKAEADYIQAMAEKAYAEPAIKAFFVFDLVGDQLAPPKEQGYGLVNVDADKNWTGSLKEAFYRYKNLIAAK